MKKKGTATNVTPEKKCKRCGKPRPNDTYGERCEDCYCDGLYSSQTRSALYPRGMKVLKGKNQTKAGRRLDA